ncbi:hypothetical protein KC359_g3 [Hortaea werneckii]|nr:hypothetical protein KC359_g3 [Hortaea werneckii]
MIPAHLVIGRLIGEFAAAGRSVEGGPAAVFVLDPGTTTVAAVAMGRGDRVPVDVGEGGSCRSGGRALAFSRFFFEEGLDAHATCFGAEVATERVGAGEARTSSPRSAGPRAACDEGALVRVRAEMGSEVVGAREALGAEGFAQGLRGRGCSPADPLRPRAGDACRRQWSVVEVRANDRDVPGCQGTEPVSLHGNQTWRARSHTFHGLPRRWRVSQGMSHSLMGIAQLFSAVNSGRSCCCCGIKCGEWFGLWPGLICLGYPNRASSDWSVLNSPSKYQMGSAGATWDACGLGLPDCCWPSSGRRCGGVGECDWRVAAIGSSEFGSKSSRAGSRWEGAGLGVGRRGVCLGANLCWRIGERCAGRGAAGGGIAGVVPAATLAGRSLGRWLLGLVLKASEVKRLSVLTGAKEAASSGGCGCG